MAEWKPIKDAPANRPILGFDGISFAVVEWNGAELGWWELSVCGLHAEDGEWTPTIWTEIPEGY